MRRKITSAVLTLIMLTALLPLGMLRAEAAGTTMRERMVATAISQIGYTEYGDNNTKYGRWYGLDGQSWCAMFVTWCARMSGVTSDVIPTFASCTSEGMKWFKAHGQWKDSTYSPKPGDLVFFDWIEESTGRRDGLAEHVGIVEYTADGKVYTIEGNSTDNQASPNQLESVMRRERMVEDIIGYGVPAYKPVLTASDWSIKLNSPSVPTKLAEGSSFSLSGTITSTNPLKWVCVDIRNADGSSCISTQSAPNIKSFDLKSIDSKIKFGTLKNGNYSYCIEAIDSANNIKQWKYDFSVCGASWKLSYNAEGGTNAPAVQTASSGSAQYVSAEKPLREGYTFIGWTDRRTSGQVVYTAGSKIQSSANVTLYALWKANEYELSFVNAGRTESVKTVKFGSIYGELPTAPAKEGYTFDGWYTAETGGIRIKESTVVSTAGDHSVYAVYKCNHTYAVETTEPTCTENGSRIYTCSRCGYSYTETIKAKGHSFDGSICTVCGYRRSFPDVDTTGRHKYCADAIDWAADAGVTLGYPDGTFKPDLSCTRAQVVTFLWRAAGMPEADGTADFSDMVSEASPYYKAILWATKNGITLGYDDNTFRPDASCSREQFVTFLWRYMDCPENTMVNPFDDVGSGAYYEAIMWAVETGVTNGCGNGKFLPHKLCTRAEVVTFIYRAVEQAGY